MLELSTFAGNRYDKSLEDGNVIEIQRSVSSLPGHSEGAERNQRVKRG